MFRTSLFCVVFSLVVSSTLGDRVKNDSSGVFVENERVSRLEGPPRISPNSSSLVEANDKPRDKRALGVILQGLAEAFGYTVSPVSIAVLPNPNATAATAAAAPPTVFTFPGIATPPPPPAQRPNPPPVPGQRPQKPLPPTIATTMTPRQQETLRFTGVVNFGNNSDLLGHLRRYEQIFHGATTTTPAPRPPPTSGPSKLGLLPPYFVKIPLPFAPGLPPILPPSPPRQIKQMTYTESYESGEITDEKDVRVNPPQGNRDTYVDEPHWLQKEGERGNNKYRGGDSSEESEPDPGPKKYRGTADRDKEASGSKDPENSHQENEDEASEEGAQRNGYREDEERGNDEAENGDEADEEDSREGNEPKKPLGIKYAKDSEESERDNDAKDESAEEESERESYAGNANKQDFTTVKNNLSNLDDPLDFVSQNNPTVPKQFGFGLPIRVFDVPFSNPGEFRNSYGHSLEHDGRTDDSLADYFQRYKHPETGLYDSERIFNLEAPQRGKPWWQDQPENRRTVHDPIQRIRQEYAQSPTKKYEEYKLRDDAKTRKAPAGQKAWRKTRKEIMKEDGTAEPTVTTYAQVKAPKNMKKRPNHTRQRHETDKKKKKAKRLSKSQRDEPEPKKTEIKRDENANAPSSKSFDIVRYNPYFRPLQIAYEPEKLQRTAERILSNHNFGKNGENVKSDEVTTAPLPDDEPKENGSGRSVDDSDKKPPSRAQVTTRAELPEGPPYRNQYPAHNAYAKPVRYVYEPESFEKTADRVSSYQNLQHSEDTGNEAGEESEESGKQGVRDSPENLRDREEESGAESPSEDLKRDEEEGEAGKDSRENAREASPQEESEEHRSSEDLKEREADRDESGGEDESSENVGYRESDEEESEGDRYPKYARGPEAEREESEGSRSSEHSKESHFQAPEEYRSSGSYYQEAEDSASGEKPRGEGQPRPKSCRSSAAESRENCDEGPSRQSESLREKAHEETGADRSSESLRENSDGEPEANRFSEKLQYYETPQVALPERLTGKELHEGEDKLVQGWPAPFDYTFDSTESTKTLRAPDYPQVPYENAQPTRVAPAVYTKYYITPPGASYQPNVSPTYGTPSFIELRSPNEPGSYYRDLTIAPTDESSTFVIPGHYRLPESRPRLQEKPENLTVPGENSDRAFEQPPRVQNDADKAQLEAGANFLSERHHGSANEPGKTEYFKEADGRRGKTRRDRLPEAPRTFDGPESAHEFFGLSPDDYELEGQRFGQRKSNGNTQTPITTPLNPTQLIQLLAVQQQDPNYQRDVVLTEFTEEPESDTEKVRVKEYRNKVATIKVSESKKLSPGGPVQLVGFTRNF